MSIQRVPQVPFAQIANSALRDKRLSFKARGILALVLSNTGEWEAGLRYLESQSAEDGRAAIQSGLNELTELGYRVVTRERIKSGIRTVVEWKHAPNDAISRPTENPTVRKPDRQETRASLEHHPKEHNSKEHNEKKEPSNVVAVVERKPDLFSTFWDIYPRRAGVGAARKAWAKAITKEDPQVILAAAIRFRDDPNRSLDFTCHASTWLNQERWDDDPLPGSKSSSPQNQRMANFEALMNLERAAISEYS